MRANAGDEIVIKGHHLGQPDRFGEVVAANGPNGEPPWTVRWDDTGRTVTFYPGPDARIEQLGGRRTRR